jgi:hypothetical protein
VLVSATTGEVIARWTAMDDHRIRVTPARGDTLFVLDGAQVKWSTSTGKFGFAVSCSPACTAARSGASAALDVKYASPPTVYAVLPGSEAERAGLRVGDVILRVGGKSITDEAGLLQRGEQRGELALTLRRSGSEIDVTLKLPRGK